MKKIFAVFFWLFIGVFFRSPLAMGQDGKIIFCPQWMPQAQFAGYYVALEKGFYKEAGLDVKIVQPTTSSSCLAKLRNGEADIICTQLVQALIEKDKGTDLINISQSNQINGLVIVAQPKYESLDELDGKRIGVWQAGFWELAYCMAHDDGHNIEWIQFPSGINYFVSQAVDAIVTMYYNEYFQVMNCGRRVTEKNVFHLSDYGYDIPEDGLYCMRGKYEKRKKDFLLFAEASKKGWEYARDHFDEAIGIVREVMEKNNIATSVAHQKWMLSKMLELQINKQTKTATFSLNPKAYKLANDLLKKNGFMRKEIPYDEFVAPEVSVKR